MNSRFESYKSLCPNMEEDLLREHLLRLSDRYFEAFDQEAVCRHLKCIVQLSPDKPLKVLFNKSDNGQIDGTIVAFDYPFAFSLICGLLGGMGFSIQSGRAFTYAKSSMRTPKLIYQRRFSRRKITSQSLQRKKLIDNFSGCINSSVSFETWQKQTEAKLLEVFNLLETGDAEAVKKAKVMVNELAIAGLSEMNFEYNPVLYPVTINVDNESGSFTRMQIFSQDTPFFLYTLSTAFSLHNIMIENVKIRTVGAQITDEFDLTDGSGRKIDDPAILSRIKLSILLTKQFTYFLGMAPDPYAALGRFEQLVEDLVQAPQKGNILEMLSSPRTMQDLAQLFGASDFLWEDFVRLQYEELLPLITSKAEKEDFIEPIETVYWRLEEYIKEVPELNEKIERINKFKDREIFQIDLDHIIHHRTDLTKLAERLTILAEIVINVTLELIYEDLKKRYGVPRTVAGQEAKFTAIGLGKFGGTALGYASDIELLFVYSDNGKTDGSKTIENSEFFNILVKEFLGSIRAKREGIFYVDLRLRPYGKDGPLACSLDGFCRYYGIGGGAHSYERLALVRLRTVGGDKEFGLQIERLRDDIIYASQSIDLKELHALREKQLKEKTRPGKINAKFSPGALVDLEYTVQLLQVMHGRDIPAMRTPRIHKALNEQTKAGVLSQDEGLELTKAYDFLRHLINGLRMLRGSAQDLFLPPAGSVEFVHLARRLGYVKQNELEPAKRLELDFETRTAVVRNFIERHFGRDSIPGPAVGNAADLVLSDKLPDELTDRILRGYGFENPKRAQVNLQKLAGSEHRRKLFAQLALLACDVLKTLPDPDMALNNWERFVGSLQDPRTHFEMLLLQPMRLNILLSIFAGSQFLADTLIKNPEFFEWITLSENVDSLLERNKAEKELRCILSGSTDHKQWLNNLRNFKKREILRIGTRDICLHAPLADIVKELSSLAGALIQVVLENIWQDIAEKEGSAVVSEKMKNAFCIMALGKLGGNELNYSSDIDLLGIYDDNALVSEAADGGSAESLYSGIMAGLRSDLSAHTEEGHAYRVDLRLRPYGRSGRLVHSLNNLEMYYRNNASLWEIQALLKIRTVAGNFELGNVFLGRIRALFSNQFGKQAVFKSIEKMRADTIKNLSKKLNSNNEDIKSGVGGIRDIEFLVQGLQLIHVHKHSELLCGNTLLALQALKRLKMLPEDTVKQLIDDYVFLRKIEHFLQIYDDRQIHSLPQDRADLNALAKRILGIEANREIFMARLKECRSKVRKAYETYVTGRSGKKV